MMVTFSSWLFVLSGMLILDTILCMFFLRKRSEGFLELTVTALIFVVAKLLEKNPIDKLNGSVFTYIAAGTVMIALCVMFYHLFFKVIPTSPYRNDKKHHSRTPAKREREE